MKFELGANVLEFEAGGDYPASRPLEKVQAVDRAASGKPEVERLGPDLSSRTIDFNDMSETDYLGLKNWHEVVADGAVNQFEFTDEKGFLGNVFITSLIFDFPETDYQLYSGSMTLEYV